MRLPDLPPRSAAVISAIDWAGLSEAEGRRLRELGFDEGVRVETLHRGPIGADPIACRVGRMTIALRRSAAAAVAVDLSGIGFRAESPLPPSRERVG